MPMSAAPMSGAERTVLTAVERQGDGENHVAHFGQWLGSEQGDGRQAEDAEVQGVVKSHAKDALVGVDDARPATAASST